MYGIDAYTDNTAETADPVELVRMLYRGAFDAVKSARGHLASGNIAARSQKLTKATTILNELALSLDHSAGGALSRSLAELYDYLQRLIMTGNFEQRDEPLAEAERLLATMLEGWENCKLDAEPQISFQDASDYTPVSCTY